MPPLPLAILAVGIVYFVILRIRRRRKQTAAWDATAKAGIRGSRGYHAGRGF